MSMTAVAFGVSAKTVGRAVAASEVAEKPIENMEAIRTLCGATGCERELSSLCQFFGLDPLPCPTVHAVSV